MRLRGGRGRGAEGAAAEVADRCRHRASQQRGRGAPRWRWRAEQRRRDASQQHAGSRGFGMFTDSGGGHDTNHIILTSPLGCPACLMCQSAHANAQFWIREQCLAARGHADTYIRPLVALRPHLRSCACDERWPAATTFAPRVTCAARSSWHLDMTMTWDDPAFSRRRRRGDRRAGCRRASS